MTALSIDVLGRLRGSQVCSSLPRRSILIAVPMGAASNAGSASFGTKVHNAALLVGKVKRSWTPRAGRTPT